MKKSKLRFPIFTPRQTSKQKLQKPSNSIRIKTKDSFSLLKMISEDFRIIEQSNRNKGNKIKSINDQKEQKVNRNRSKRKNEVINCKKGQGVPSLQIKRIEKTQTYKTIIPQTGLDIVTARKTKVVSKQKQGGSINLKLSGSRVIVARNRKQFSKINQEYLYERRQNYLNSKFNDRVSRLDTITKQNKRIYDRINSQRSHYSNDQLNKSYESNASLSKRLSDSKISRRSRLSLSSERSVSSSRCSIASKGSIQQIRHKQGLQSKQVLKAKISAPRRLIKIESKNINELKVEQLQNFVTLFTVNQPLQKVKVKSKTTRKHNESSECKENIEYATDLKKNVSIEPETNRNRLPSLSRFAKKMQDSNMTKEGSKQRQRLIQKNILSTINQNTIRGNSYSRNLLQQIIQETSNPGKNNINKYTRR